MSFFSLDSKFSQIMGRVFDLMMLNTITAKILQTAENRISAKPVPH